MQESLLQDYVPFFQALSLKWYQLTLDNAVYATCLAVSIWLLTAIFYSIRISLLNGKISRSLKAHAQTQVEFEASQQQASDLQQALQEAGEQLDKERLALADETSRAAALESKLAEVTGRVAENVAKLASQFKLDAVALAVDSNDDSYWQQYRQLLTQLDGRFAAEQQAKAQLEQARQDEAAKVTEKEALLGALRSKLEAQSNQINVLETTLAEQNLALQQHQQKVQQIQLELEQRDQAIVSRVSAVVDVAPVTIPEAENLNIAAATPEPVEEALIIPAVLEPVSIPETVIEANKTPDVEVPVISETAASPEIAVVVTETPAAGLGGKFKQLYSSTRQKISKLDDKFAGEAVVVAKEDEPQVGQEEPAIPAAIVESQMQEATLEKSAAGLGGKFKSLFGKSSASAAAVEEKPVTPLAESVETPAKPQDKPLKGLWRKLSKSKDA